MTGLAASVRTRSCERSIVGSPKNPDDNYESVKKIQIFKIVISCELSILGSPNSLANVSSPTECGYLIGFSAVASSGPHWARPPCLLTAPAVGTQTSWSLLRGHLHRSPCQCVAAQTLLVIVNTAYYYTGRRCTSEMLLGHSRCRGGWPGRIR